MGLHLHSAYPIVSRMKWVLYVYGSKIQAVSTAPRPTEADSILVVSSIRLAAAAPTSGHGC